MGEFDVFRDVDIGGWRSGEDTDGTGSGREWWFELLGAFGASNEFCFAVTGGVPYRASGGFASWGDVVLCFANRSVKVYRASSVDGLQAYL